VSDLSGASSSPSPSTPRVGFVLEQTLGHITHADNLARLIPPDPRIHAEFALVPFELDPRWARVPGHGNWTVRAGLRARRAVRALGRAGPLDALFVHTQVAATLMPDVLGRTPSVVSLDATPIQYDQLGDHYGHATNSERVEGAKWRLHRACFARAERLVTWSQWAKDGLVDQYEVAPDKVVVIAPGVDYDRWADETRPRDVAADGAPIRILFVGGDLTRKGGRTLIDSVRRLRSDDIAVELDLVTHDHLPPEDGIIVHNGLGPNSPALIELYQRAHIFCLPTLGDCLPMVLSEAGAMGLPLVSTDVGAIREIVRPERTGLLVPRDDGVALTAALGRLVTDPALRRSLGANAQQLVRDDFDAATNASRLVDVLVEVATNRR
jgi:glycosyltransferase involved in cell wall biosynthesis